MHLAFNKGLTGLSPGVERVELQIEIMFGGFAGVDRAAESFVLHPVHAALSCCGLPAFPTSPSRRPKNLGPFQLVPVMVSYNLTFTGPNAVDDGTGILKLVLASFPDSNTINYTGLPNSIFSSLTVNIGAGAFSLTDSNISGGGVQGTSSSSIDVAVTESTSGLANGTDFLQLNNTTTNAGNFDIHRVNNGDAGDGTFTIGAPFIATSVPEPLSLSIFGAGLVGAAAMRRRKKAKQV